MRLINADKLLQHKRKMSGADFGGEFWDEAVLVSDIENAPTIDAVKVVRCQDCEMQSSCKVAQHLGNDGFCSKGERRDDDA